MHGVGYLGSGIGVVLLSQISYPLLRDPSLVNPPSTPPS